MKLPATNTSIYSFTYSWICTIANPMNTPIKDKKFTNPLQHIVWIYVN